MVCAVLCYPSLFNELPMIFKEISWKFPWKRCPLDHNSFYLVMVETKQIELPSLNSNPNRAEVDINSANVKPVSVKTLFFKYASRKEKGVFFLGFLCTIHSFILNHSCCYSWSTHSTVFYVLWNDDRWSQLSRHWLWQAKDITSWNRFIPSGCFYIRLFGAVMSRLLCR